jgi:hypothetical protein
MHTSTLSFVTLALVNMMIPFDAAFMNPVIPSWHVDEGALCRDIDAGFGWEVLAALLHNYVGCCVEWGGADRCAVVGVVDCEAVGQGVEVPETERQDGCGELGVFGEE